MEYKDTLNMPKTEFDMRGNLTEKDKKFIDFWVKNELYSKLSNRKNSKQFILHDGPPYANGDIHTGHALNKIIKDIIVRDNALQGKSIDWRLGWDTHGLPIENKVQQSGIKLSEVGKEAYLKACYDYAYSQVNKQQDQFKKLGLLTDFDQKYLTLQPEFESRQIGVFHKMLNKNLIYQDLKPVYWSWSSETALAEAEIEYKESKDFSIFVKFKLENSDLNFVIWTTTPWTLPANVAISFGEKIEYAIYELENEKIVIAKQLANNVSKTIDKELKYIDDINIKEYIGKDAINPLNSKKSRLVWGHHVTTEGGTGLVHTAGGHGHDDYLIVKNNNLDLFVVMDDKGHMINADDLNGMFYLKANKIVVDKLEENNTLVFATKFTHSVPIDWRTKEPVIYRATKQWFVSIDPIKKDLINEIKNVEWVPAWGEDRLTKMTENRNDWCISRQRLWGVPIPIIYDENSNPIIDSKLQENIEKAFNENGIMAWHNMSIKDLLPEHIQYSEKMTKETDILDVWFDSGSSYELLQGQQSDVLLEGNDQYRGWFNSSLINSYVTQGKAPYKTVLTHGMVTDEKGNKMSKSLGNGVDPIGITSKLGSDILRLWAASSDYQDNVRISDDIIKQVSNDYRKIRNTIRFILGNINDFDANDFDENNLSNMTKSILNEIEKSFSIIRKQFESYNFLKAFKELMNQLTTGAIQYILDYYKEIGYIVKSDDVRRRELQYALNETLKFIMYTMGPIIPVTIEEAWQEINPNTSFFENTHPTFSKYDASDFNEFLLIKESVNKEIEELRSKKIVKKSNEIEAKIELPTNIKVWNQNLAKFLMIAKATVKESTNEKINVTVKKFDGIKCERCWNYFAKEDMAGEICKTTCDKVINN